MRSSSAMTTTTSRLTEAFSLDSFPFQSRPNSDSNSTRRTEHEGTIETTEPLTEADADIAPSNAATDQRPTRNYQLMLLLSGFCMTFHVIGINLVYGIFQVSLHNIVVHNDINGELTNCIFLRRNSTLLPKVISQMARAKTHLCR